MSLFYPNHQPAVSAQLLKRPHTGDSGRPVYIMLTTIRRVYPKLTTHDTNLVWEKADADKATYLNELFEKHNISYRVKEWVIVATQQGYDLALHVEK